MRENTTFILAGYKEEINTLLSYNQGFKSRFSKELTFVFDDFSEVRNTPCLTSSIYRHTTSHNKTYIVNAS